MGSKSSGGSSSVWFETMPLPCWSGIVDGSVEAKVLSSSLCFHALNNESV